MVKLDNAERAVLTGNKACGDLTAVQNHVAAQSGKQLTPAQAAQQSTLAGAAKALLAC